MICLTWSPTGVSGHLLGKPRVPTLGMQSPLWQMDLEAPNPCRPEEGCAYRYHLPGIG